MGDLMLRFLYGAIVIGSAFLVFSMSRLARREWKDVGAKAAMGSTYFWLAANAAGDGAAILLICGNRVVAAFHGDVARGYWAPPLIVGFAMLFASRAGFNWAGTMNVRHGRVIWISFVSTVILWLVFVVTWPSPLLD